MTKKRSNPKKAASSPGRKKKAPSQRCKICGLKYDDFRTGETYRGTYATLWRAEDDPAVWRNKNRHGVLGAWHGYKMMLWAAHVAGCEEQRAWERQQAKKKTSQTKNLWKSLSYDEAENDENEVPF